MSESTQEATETEEQEPTTTKRLWEGRYQNNGMPTVETKESEVSEDVETESVTEETPDKTETPEPEYLNPEDFGDKSFKLNVGGEEVTVNVKDALRRLQTDKYLTQEGQKLAEERRQLDTLKNSVVDKSAETKSEDDLGLDYEDESSKEVIALKKEMADMAAKLGSVQQSMAPTMHEQDMRMVDDYLKNESSDGEFDDFMLFRPEIESHFLTYSVEDQARIGLPDYVNEYKNRKMRKVLSKSQEKSTEPAEKREAPAVVNILGGGGTPSSSDTDADDAKYRKEFEKAQETGNWGPVFALKGIPNM